MQVEIRRRPHGLPPLQRKLYWPVLKQMRRAILISSSMDLSLECSASEPQSLIRSLSITDHYKLRINLICNSTWNCTDCRLK